MGKSLLNLKRKEIRKIISYTNEEGIIEEIKIFNPSPKVQDEIKETLLSYSSKSKGKLKLNIPSEVVISEIITKVTDLEIPKDAKEEDIIEVIQDPSIPLQKVMAEVITLLVDLGEIGIKFIAFMDNVTKLTGITDEEMAKLIASESKKEVKPKEKAKPKKAKKKTTKKEDNVVELKDKEVKEDEKI